MTRPSASLRFVYSRFLTCIVFLIIIASIASPGIAQDRGLQVMAREITGKADFDVGKQFAVIIGIDKYREWPSLKAAASC